ncbi:MAG: DUF6691 family protein [Alphaproteobacteria bacterium]
MRSLVGLLCGVVFGLGLIIAQMTNPAKVIGFLDILNGWDPSLAFVMGGGLVVFGVGFIMLKGRKNSFLGASVRLPTASQIDAPLVLGAVLFGAGWGLSGLCPGPALAALTIGGSPAFTFVVAMVVGMFLHQLYQRQIR